MSAASARAGLPPALARLDSAASSSRVSSGSFACSSGAAAACSRGAAAAREGARVRGWRARALPASHARTSAYQGDAGGASRRRARSKAARHRHRQVGEAQDRARRLGARVVSDAGAAARVTTAAQIHHPASCGPTPPPERPRGNSSTGQAMANSVNILLGVGLLSVPYALRQGGWAGLGVLASLGLMTNYTGKALIRCQSAGSLPPLPADVEVARRERSFDDDDDDPSGTRWDPNTVAPRRRPLMTYEDIGEAAFGSPGRSFITWVLYTELVGTCALFFILEGDHLALLFEGSGKDSAWFQAASAAVMVPTLWLADLSSLSYVGAVGALASISLVGVIAYELFAVGGFPGTLPAGLETTAALHLATLPVSFGLLAFVFAGHAVFPAIYSSMETPEEYEGMLDKTYAIVGVTCAVIGAAGYALWGDAVKDEVTLNLPGGALSTLALALITVNPFSKFALTMDPVARGLESRMGVDIDAEDGDGPFKARVLRTGLGLGALLTAAKVPCFAVVMSLIGSFLTLTVSVIFPSACYLKMFEDELDEGEMAINWIIMFVGGFCVVAGSVSALEQITNAAS